MSRHDLPSLTALHAFEAVARLGSMSRAADTLHVTHGAVSRQIRALEDELGTPLFTREGRGVRLTTAGAELAEHCRAAFDRLRGAWAALQRDREPRHFVLGCSGSVLARWIIPRLERLRHALPELRLHIAVQDDAANTDLGGVDASLRVAAPPWPEHWQVETLLPEAIGPVLSPRYPGADALVHAPPAALAGEPLLATASRPTAWGDWARAAGLAADALRETQPLPHLYFLLEAANAGLGVAIAPELLVADDLASGRLLAPWGFRQTAASWVLATPAGPRDPRLPALSAWLRAALA